MGLSIGDEVVISSPLDQNSIFGFPSTVKTSISGIFFSKILDYDNRYILISNRLGNKIFYNNLCLQFINLSSKPIKLFTDAKAIIFLLKAVKEGPNPKLARLASKLAEFQLNFQIEYCKPNVKFLYLHHS